MERKERGPRTSLRKVFAGLFLPFGIVFSALLWAAFLLFRPTPPDTIVMTAGTEGGAYLAFAEKYRSLLERKGIRLVVLPSTGSEENLSRLRDPSFRVDVGFVQSGTADGTDSVGLVSLGSLFHEPLWGFHAGTKPIATWGGLRGKRLAIGIPGSGTRKIVSDLLASIGVDASNTTLREIGGEAAVEAVRDGTVDVAFLFASPQAPIVREMLRIPGIGLYSLDRAEAYPLHFPFLTAVRLPAGGIDLRKNIPARDTDLIASTAELVARDTLHPALVDLLLDAAGKVHGGSGIFQKEGEFPAPRRLDFPVSEDALRYYRAGLTFFYRHLPFWAANLVRRLLVILVPVFGFLYPVARVLPPLLRWRFRSRIYRWYGDLMALEYELQTDPVPEHREKHLERLSWIEKQVSGTWPPASFGEERFSFLFHIETLRRRILRRESPGETGGRAG